jgi:DcuC family C4-dicarboxylate transporter
MIGLAAAVVLAAVLWAILRGAEVRLTLILAALVLGLLGDLGAWWGGDPTGKLAAVVQTFLGTFTREQFVLPICCCMGFAYVLRETGCDRHLVLLLVKPLRRVRGLLIPGVVLIGAVVNIPIISQTSTLVLVGAVLVPLLRAARISPVTTGAGLLLGASIGGELLNPGAPEVRTVAENSQVALTPALWGARVLPLFLVDLAVAVVVFWIISRRAEERWQKETAAREADKVPDEPRVSLVRALVPFVPIVLLFVTGLPEPFRLIEVPESWLVNRQQMAGQKDAAVRAIFDSRLTGLAMLIGVVLAALTDRERIGRTALCFFEGAGFAFAQIISLIVAAASFGKSVEEIGLAALLSRLLTAAPQLLLPAAVLLPMGFALLCGSGMATTQSLFGFFVEPAHRLGHDPLHLGAVISLSSAAGRTLSPLAAVTLMAATLTETSPLQLVRRNALPLLAGVAAMLLAAFVLG